MSLRSLAASLFAPLGLALLALAGLCAQPAAAKPAAARAKAAPARAAAPLLAIATPTGSHVIGRPTAPVKLVEYVSYTCPHCAAFEIEGHDPLIATMVRPGRVSVEYRPYLRNIIDAAATLLVGCGGPSRFAGNHAAVMRGQQTWMVQPTEAQIQRWNTGEIPARLKAVASDMGLYALLEARGYTRAALDQCLTNQPLVETIANENQASGIEGTPSFFINGKLVEAHDWAGLRPLLEAAAR